MTTTQRKTSAVATPVLWRVALLTSVLLSSAPVVVPWLATGEIHLALLPISTTALGLIALISIMRAQAEQ